jgi:Transposase
MTPRTGWPRPPGMAGPDRDRRHRHVQHLRLGGAPHAAWRATRRGPVPRRAPGGQDDRGHAAPGGLRQVWPPGPVRRPGVRHQGLLVRDLEHLSPGQFAKVMAALGSDPGGQEIAAAWIGKEKLRPALNLRARVTGSVPCERNVRDRLFAFYDWCAGTMTSPSCCPWPRRYPDGESEIVAAVLTGITNSVSESLNRLAKLEARRAYGFRNPANQRRRARIACRGKRRRSRQVTTEDAIGNRTATRSRLTSKSRECEVRPGTATRHPTRRASKSSRSNDTLSLAKEGTSGPGCSLDTIAAISSRQRANYYAKRGEPTEGCSV